MKVILIFLIFLSYMHARIDMQKKTYMESKATIYVPFSISEFEIATSLFENLFLGNDQVYEQAKLLGLRLIQDKEYIIIVDTQKRGWGFYVIRQGAFTNNLLSIPHGFFDLGTAQIGYQLMIKNPYRGIAYNTVHRSISDLAHTKYSLFNAFHKAFALVYKDDYIYQLHGFSNLTRKSETAKNTNAIISTTTLPSKKILRISECLNKINYDTLVFGIDVFELGGTTNSQAAILRNQGYQNFIHLELNKSFREKLISDKLLQKKVQQCL